MMLGFPRSLVVTRTTGPDSISVKALFSFSDRIGVYRWVTGAWTHCALTTLDSTRQTLELDAACADQTSSGRLAARS
ncbi:MAG TPA: hypothetical protein VF795_03125, partial [Desulfuromonadaceae bacterium]